MTARHRRSGTPHISGRWIHLFEEDSARGAVYVPEPAEVPLSRRPREMLEFAADGVARVYRPSADDRLAETVARWTTHGSEIHLHLAEREVMRAVLEAPERLLVLPAGAPSVEKP